MLRKDLDHKKTKKKVLLTLEGIEFTEPPKHLYKVYFNLRTRMPKPGSAEVFGTLAFFESDFVKVLGAVRVNSIPRA